MKIKDISMRELDSENNKKFMQHNAITSGRFDFSACQLDIMFMLLAGLDKEFTEDRWYKIHVKDIEKITGRKWNYQQLQEATEEMGSRMFSIETVEIGKNGETGTSIKQRWLFSGVDYLSGTGSFQIKINPEMEPYFFALKNNFTVLQLKSILSCSSKYAKRLYTIACQWLSVGKVTLNIGELKETLGLKDPKGKEKEQYAEITMFKKHVLDVAKKQINEHTDITFDYKLLKSGRSFDRIVILCGMAKIKNAQKEIDYKFSPEELRRVTAIEAYDISKEMAEKIVKKCWKEFVEVKNQTIEDMQKGKTIEHSGKYIIGILQNKGLIDKKAK